MKEHQLEFDFGPEDVVQRFLGTIKTKFGDKLREGRLDGKYWIKSSISIAGHKKWYVSRRTYAAVEVEWDFVMNLTSEEVAILKETDFAQLWG